MHGMWCQERQRHSTVLELLTFRDRSRFKRQEQEQEQQQWCAVRAVALVLSCLVLSCLVLSCLVLSYLAGACVSTYEVASLCNRAPARVVVRTSDRHAYHCLLGVLSTGTIRRQSHHTVSQRIISSSHDIIVSYAALDHDHQIRKSAAAPYSNMGIGTPYLQP